MIWFVWQWARRQGRQETWLEYIWNGVVERVFSCLNGSGWLVLQKHYRHFWAWNEISHHLPVLFWLARADSGVSVQGRQRSLDAQNSSWSAAEHVEFNINLLEAEITCNALTGSWSVSPDRFQRRENELSLCLKRFPRAFGCCCTRDPEGFPSCPWWAGPAQPLGVWEQLTAHPNWSHSAAGS